MRIDEEIQSTFSSEYHRAIVNLMYTYGFVTNSLERLLNEHGVTRQQFNVLRILRGQYPNPAPVSLSKERMLHKMSDASRIIDRLRKKNLVVKKVCDQDRRSADIMISDSGLELLEILDPVVSDYNSLLHGLSKNEAQQLNELLDKIRC